MWYSTLHQVRQYLNLAVTETDDDGLLKQFCRQATETIDKYCRRRFDVRLETRVFDYPIQKRDSLGVYSAEAFVAQMNAVADWIDDRLRMDDDLLAVTTLTNGDDVEIDSDDFILEPANKYPKFTIRLVESSGVSWQYGANGERRQVIDVQGDWGYHPRYGDLAWCDSLDTVQDDPLTAGGTTLTVNDADGVAGDATDTRYQVGQLLRIEDEYLFVVAVDTVTNELTVTRAQNGTIAVAHAQGTQIDVYRPPDNIVLACTRLVAHTYRLKDTGIESAQQVIGTGVSITPQAIPATVEDLLPSPRPVGLK